MSDKCQKIFYWLPRLTGIICAAFCFILAFGVFVEEDWTPLEKTIGFFMQLIPFLIMIVLLLISWKWELIGGICYVILGIAIIVYMIIFRSEICTILFFFRDLYFSSACYLLSMILFLKKRTPHWKYKCKF